MTKKMNKWLLCLVFSAMLPWCAGAQIVDDTFSTTSSFNEPVDSWQREMAGRLDFLMSDPLLQTSQLGLMVFDLTTNKMLYAKNERQRMRPASVMKLVTAITALDTLGTDYEYLTRIGYQGRIVGDTLIGNLYFIGGFDPTVTTGDVREMATRIRDYGIRYIEGLLVADLSMKDSLWLGKGWCWDDDDPHLVPLLVDGKDQWMSSMMTELQRLGVGLSVSLARGKMPKGATEICCFRSHIDKVLTQMMKESDNLYAESLLYQTALAASKQGVGTAEGAAGVTKRLLRRLGLTPRFYTIADGSGLSLYNYVTAEMMVRLLRHAYEKSDIFAHLYPALPIAGVDGTLKKRMKTGSCAGNVHAKTGTVSAVSTLSGYCTAANGHLLCFCILNQGIVKADEGRDFQNRVCSEMCR